jgi:aryl-alcohol dehydrogenase-like predicted oxidoreductase
MAEKNNISKTTLAMSFCAQTPGISTVIPGIKTPSQAESNCSIVPLDRETMSMLNEAYQRYFSEVVTFMEQQG